MQSVSSPVLLLESLINDNGDPEDTAKKKNELIFYLPISRLSRSVHCAYSQNLLKLNM